jgi:hypothetical protein
MKHTQENMAGHLQTGVATVVFTKTNGEQRVMLCTTDISRIPAEDHPKGITESAAGKSEANANVLRVYDIENEGWRSFKTDSVTSFTPADV